MDRMEYVLAHLAKQRIISRSTNEVGLLAAPFGEVIVKRPVPGAETSAFWQRMRLLFASDFAAQRRALADTVSLLRQGGEIPPPEPVGTGECPPLTAFMRMPGERWEPDAFPPGESIAFALGRHIGSLHSIRYAACGLPGGERITDFPERLRDYIRQRTAGRTLPGAVSRFLQSGELPCTYSLIMADISANQFLFTGEGISACVDLDGCVIGPAEWELELIESTCPDMAAFRRGYELFRPYPDMSATRGLFSFVMEL